MPGRIRGLLVFLARGKEEETLRPEEGRFPTAPGLLARRIFHRGPPFLVVGGWSFVLVTNVLADDYLGLSSSGDFLQ